MMFTKSELLGITKLINREIRERRCNISLENLFELERKVKLLKTEVKEPE